MRGKGTRAEELNARWEQPKQTSATKFRTAGETEEATVARAVGNTFLHNGEVLFNE